MTTTVNELGQPIGFPVVNWHAPARPPREAMVGRYCRVEPLSVERHAADLFEAYRADTDNRIWTYLPYGPFESAEAYTLAIKSVQGLDDPMPFAIVDPASDRPVGVASYLNIAPPMGSIEVGAILYSPALQRSPAATEAMYLMMRRVFDEIGYRRYEWKCDSLNAASRRAAERLGFSFEGIFRQAWVVKGRNRDTAWYSVIDSEWPALRTAFERWLDPSNFDVQGRQRARLEDLRS